MPSINLKVDPAPLSDLGAQLKLIRREQSQAAKEMKQFVAQGKEVPKEVLERVREATAKISDFENRMAANKAAELAARKQARMGDSPGPLGGDFSRKDFRSLGKGLAGLGMAGSQAAFGNVFGPEQNSQNVGKEVIKSVGDILEAYGLIEGPKHLQKLGYDAYKKMSGDTAVKAERAFERSAAKAEATAAAKVAKATETAAGAAESGLGAGLAAGAKGGLIAAAAVLAVEAVKPLIERSVASAVRVYGRATDDNKYASMTTAQREAMKRNSPSQYERLKKDYEANYSGRALAQDLGLSTPGTDKSHLGLFDDGANRQVTRLRDSHLAYLKHEGKTSMLDNYWESEETRKMVDESIRQHVQAEMKAKADYHQATMSGNFMGAIDAASAYVKSLNDINDATGKPHERVDAAQVYRDLQEGEVFMESKRAWAHRADKYQGVRTDD